MPVVNRITRRRWRRRSTTISWQGFRRCSASARSCRRLRLSATRSTSAAPTAICTRFRSGPAGSRTGPCKGLCTGSLYNLSLLALLRVVRVLLTRAAQHAAERVVAFVAGVLVEVFLGVVQRVLAGRRLVPGRRIVHGEPIEQRVRAGPREALDDVQVL